MTAATEINMKESMIRLLGITMLMLLLHAIPVSAQTPNELPAYTPVGKEKLKEIVCQHTPIKMVGWVDKKEFVDNSPIQIWNTSDHAETLIVSGIVKKSGNATMISGTYYGRYTPETIEYADQRSSFGRGSIGALAAMGSFGKNSGYDGYKNKGDHRVDGIFKVWNNSNHTLIATDKSKKINDLYGYEPFCIWIDHASECHSDFYPEIFSGRQRIVMHQQVHDNGDWVIEINPDMWRQAHQQLGECKEIESVTRVTRDFSYDITGEWTVRFTNGDRWVGEIYSDRSTERNTYLSGTLYLSNGEVIRSGLEGIGSRYIYCDNQKLSALHNFGSHGHISIEARAADGEEIAIGAYRDLELDIEEQRAIYNSCYTPEGYVSEIQKRNAAKIVQQEEERLQRNADREARYIQKYGAKFGKALSEKNLMKGMSQEMVNELFPRQLYRRMMSGNKVTWYYDRNANNSYLGALFAIGVAEAGKSIPLQLDFVNDKLVSILY